MTVRLTIVLSALQMYVFAASVQTIRVNDINFDDNQSIVTNVSFDGLATAEDVHDATSGLLRSELDPTVPSWAKQDIPPEPGNYLTVSNRAMTALQQHQSLAPSTNYTDIVSSRKQDLLPFPTNAIPYSAISGKPDISEFATHEEVYSASKASTNYTDAAISRIPQPDFSDANEKLVETIKKTSPAPGAYETVSNRAMTALQSHQSLAPSTNYTDGVAARKQDRLPYPTNAIPYSAISGVPSLVGYATKSEVGSAASGLTNYVDSQISKIPDPDFTSGNSVLVSTIHSEAPAPGNYETVSNRAMTALQQHQSLSDYYRKSEVDAMAGRMQPALPYPTNAIPYSAISGTPSLSGFATKQDVARSASDSTNYVDAVAVQIISTNNPAFVSAVTNCPVSMPESDNMGDIGTYGTVGAVLVALWAAVSGLKKSKEDSSNKTTTISSQSTDSQYPSAKCVYDIVGDIESALADINGDNT